MTAPRSVWVLVWPDGKTGGSFDTYESADHMRRITAQSTVVLRYDLAGVVDDVERPAREVYPWGSGGGKVDVRFDVTGSGEPAARPRDHRHFCLTCSRGDHPGAGCVNCRWTGMDQSPCPGCPGNSDTDVLGRRASPQVAPVLTPPASPVADADPAPCRAVCAAPGGRGRERLAADAAECRAWVGCGGADVTWTEGE